ncbi:MAG: PilT/PilU family type 4a pilus ATPase [Planctomycetales bacterium]|nr:PilT/PilU family type 4a pilus ATPase [Planctomycetales bacterium]
MTAELDDPVQQHWAPPEQQLYAFLSFMSKHNASDLHLKSDLPPYFRIGGHLRKIQGPTLPTAEYIEQMLLPLVPSSRVVELEETGGVDFSTKIDTGDRFRINLYKSTGHAHAAIRRVQSQIPSFNDLHLPDVYGKVIAESMEGLVLVSGVTGSGKSSTLAAMMDHINEHRSMHVITIEDPIAFVFQSKKCIVSQREVGIDVLDFKTALRHVVRQDPDCILIGELRDRETMLAAIQAAETGHLVMGSLHCSDAQQTFSRILEFFPRAEHAFIRSSLANSLRAITVQRLIPGLQEGSRYPACEVLLNNAIVKDKILHEEDEDMPAIVQQCREEGMRNFTHSLVELVQAQLIDRHVALDYAPQREKLISELKGIKAASESLVGRLRH